MGFVYLLPFLIIQDSLTDCSPTTYPLLLSLIGAVLYSHRNNNPGKLQEKATKKVKEN